MEQEFESESTLVERLLPQVQMVMQVSAKIAGAERTGAQAQYRGKLQVPSRRAYELLLPHFEREGVTPLLREHEGEHVIIAVDRPPEAGPGRPWLNAVLFGLTVLSVLYTGISHAWSYLQPNPNLPLPELIRLGLPLAALYAASLLAILLAHEFGHYLMGRYHRTPVSLPFFIPFPSLFGTLGAFIQLKSPSRDRRALFDIGVAGPLAGMVVAVPVILIGLAFSQVDQLPGTARAAAGSLQEGNSILYLAMKYLVHGQLLPQPTSYEGVPPLMYWARFILTGRPAPLGGTDVLLHPVAFAGWAGFLVTGLNLIPVGQLDGGHALYSLLGRRARLIWLPIVVGMAIWGVLVWTGWLLWAGLVYFFGRVHATPLDDVTELDPGRRALAIAVLILFVLIVTPVPIQPLAAP